MIVLGAATIDLVAVALTDRVLKCRIWTAKHRTGRVVVKRANAFRTFNAAVAIASVVAAAGSAGSAAVAAADSEAGAEINAWNFSILFLETSNHNNH